MYIGALSGRTSITLPGTNMTISMQSIVDMLCRKLFGVSCNCQKLAEYTPQALRAKVSDLLVGLILDAIPGVDCSRVDPVQLLADSISISGGGSYGISFDVSLTPAVRAAANQLLCRMARSAQDALSVIDPLVGAVVTFIQETTCPSLSSGGVTVNTNQFGIQPQPTPPQEPLEPPPPQQQTYTSTWSPTVFPKRKSSAVPILIAGGVALAASAVILSRRR